MLKTGGEQTAKQSATGATGAPGVTDADAGTEVLSHFGVTLDEVKLQWRATKNVVPILTSSTTKKMDPTITHVTRSGDIHRFTVAHPAVACCRVIDRKSVV